MYVCAIHTQKVPANLINCLAIIYSMVFTLLESAVEISLIKAYHGKYIVQWFRGRMFSLPKQMQVCHISDFREYFYKNKTFYVLETRYVQCQ